MTGTSVATAVLMGVAALVVEFSRLRAAQAIFPDGAEAGAMCSLLTNAGMKRVLYHCLAGTNPPPPRSYSFVLPWLLFNPDKTPEDVAYEIRQAMTKKPAV